MSGSLLEMQAREITKMGEDWTLFRWRALGDPTKLYEVTGCITPPPYATGPRKGQPNYARMDRTSQRTVHITPAEREAWVKAWEERTGNCRECVGTGKTVYRISGAGTEYKTCYLCRGSGKKLSFPPTPPQGYPHGL